MSNEKPMSPSQQLMKIKEKIQAKCPLAVEEVISSLARCELVYNNCDDKIEKYFAKESINVLQDLGGQLLSLAAHPNIQQIVESAPQGFEPDGL
jgi:hypothetical protein